LIVGLLINGVAYAAIFMIVALVIYRFAGEFASRSFLVLFLFIAAGLYIVFALRAGEGILWSVGEVVGVAIFGGMALGCLTSVAARPAGRQEWTSCWIAHPKLLEPDSAEHPRLTSSRSWENHLPHTLVNKAKKKGSEPEAPPFRVAFYLATQ
jgi:hypothetical protein